MPVLWAGKGRKALSAPLASIGKIDGKTVKLTRENE